MDYLSIQTTGPQYIDHAALPEAHSATLPSLKCFRLNFRQVNLVSRRLAQRINAPNLERLEVTHVSMDDLKSVDAFIRTSARSFVTVFSIKQLSDLSNDEYPDVQLCDILLPILRNLPALHRLYIYHIHDPLNFTPLFDTLIRAQNDQQPPCPQLKELHLAGNGVRSSAHALQDWVENRLGSSEPAASPTSRPLRLSRSAVLQAIYLQEVWLIDIEDFTDQTNEFGQRERNPTTVAPLSRLLEAEKAGVLKYGVSIGSWDDGWEIR
ncbi:hypothetical protein BDV98DRAFT_594349 [Pterulicium gracile]|uniref:F-box domain-containing protein n=1 Tax=Pterulicium gracile TaxID=1884261 RepID=A0A5C3QIX3_9AGAR|nr:hypothetical protein BDV98DRAFT_594349 [Pterula gracilis]